MQLKESLISITEYRPKHSVATRTSCSSTQLDSKTECHKKKSGREKGNSKISPRNSSVRDSIKCTEMKPTCAITWNVTRLCAVSPMFLQSVQVSKFLDSYAFTPIYSVPLSHLLDKQGSMRGACAQTHTHTRLGGVCKGVSSQSR